MSNSVFVTSWTAACQASLSFTIWSLLKLIESVMPSNHLVLCCPLLLLHSIFFQHQALFLSWLFASGGQSTGASASSSVLPLISFRIDWFDLLAVQATLKSLLQHHSLKASILRCSAIFIVQLSHPYMTTGKIMHAC